MRHTAQKNIAVIFLISMIGVLSCNNSQVNDAEENRFEKEMKENALHAVPDSQFILPDTVISN